MALRNSIKQILKKVLGEYIYFLLRRFYGFIHVYLSWNGLVLEFYYLWIRYLRQPQKPFDKSLRVDSKAHPKPHILMIAEKWHAHNVGLGPSARDWTFFGPLEVSGLATYDRLNCDEYPNRYSFDKEVLNICSKNKPDLVFVTSWLLSPLRLKTMKVIREQLRLPIVVVWGDAVSHWEEAKSLFPFVDLSLLDISEVSLENITKPETGRMLGLILYARDPRIFYNPNINRDIHVSFVGSTKDYNDRLAAISALRANGIDVYQSGGQRENRLSIDEYACVLMRSKITLSFCRHAYGKIQVKPHIFEGAMCGAMVLEADNPLTAKFFEPMVDYVPFTDEKDLVEKVRYYLAHNAEREEIAANGQKKVNEKYNAKILWKTVLGKVLGTSF